MHIERRKGPVGTRRGAVLRLACPAGVRWQWQDRRRSTRRFRAGIARGPMWVAEVGGERGRHYSRRHGPLFSAQYSPRHVLGRS